MKRICLSTFVRPLGILCAAAVAIAWGHASAAEPGRGAIVFNRDVRPILSDNCFSCHGIDAKHRKADLRLDTAEGMTADNDGSRAVVPGDVAKSALIARIDSADPSEVMPPPDSHKKLTPAQRDVLRRWIEQGAPYQKHWSFEPIAKPALPAVGVAVANPIDAFLLDRLHREQVTANAEADRRTLARRAAFALTGLPPTPAEVDAFVKDSAPGGYERLVEHYLASPRFGEEMARHWLDLARYGDTHGLHLDNERQMWAYRDYVVKSFNDNKPFDRFTVEQIAGDLLRDPGRAAPTTDQLIATGFNRCNVTTSEGGSIPAEYQFRYAVDRASTVATAWMGLTAGCAQCHDHKFDPISAKEFYSLYAFFNSAADPAMDGNALQTHPTVKIASPEQEKHLADLTSALEAKQKALDAKTAELAYADPADANPKPPVEETQTVWLDDAFPPGAAAKAGPGAPTQWVTSVDGGGAVYSGERAIKRTDKGLAQDYYEGGAAPLTIPTSGEFFAYVYLDPKDPPRSIMLQFHKGGWKYRAVWGDYNVIEWGTPATTERVNMGPLPALSQWVRLEVPSAKLGLEAGDQITGFAVTQFGGTVYWDKLGITGRSDRASDPAQSFAAWRAARVGMDTPAVPPDIAKLLKAGPDKVKQPEELKKLREYYLQNVCATTKGELAPLFADVAKVKKEREDLDKSIPSSFVFTDAPKPNDSFVMIRGQYDQKGEPVEPATPAFLPALRKASPDAKARATRLDLALWLVSPEHPLTARVAANRLWQQFFGTGLVKTSADFGSQGEPPSHPELLDFLAATYRDTAWDTKGMVRLLVTSAAFKRSSVVKPEFLARDPANRLYARGPRFRLDSEQIRDNALFVSGLMVDKMGGPGVKPYQPPNIWEPVGFVGSNTRFYKQDSGDALYRRSLYVFIKRTAPAPFLSNFDAPNREQCTTLRERSNTPLQALQLMNDTQQFEAARALAQRMMTEGGASPAERIAFAYRTVLSRAPEADETAVLQEQLAAHLDRYTKDEAAAKKALAHGASKPRPDLKPSELAAYTMVASTVLNLDETLNRN
jgi:mono/diheme cytochrome c family protein